MIASVALCRGCSSAVPPQRAPGRRREWCSNACRTATRRREDHPYYARQLQYHRDRVRQRRSTMTVDCWKCGRPVEQTILGRLRGRCADRTTCRVALLLDVRPCVRCSTVFQPTARRVVRCESCRGRQRPERVASHRVVKRMAQAIFDRDGWRCQLCGGHLDASLIGQRHNHQRPSIDHVVPLSRGGTDDATNLQAAHLRCNEMKGAR